MKDYEFDRVIAKFGFETRDSGDRLAWLIVDGYQVINTKRSKGRGELPFSHKIRQQLKLNETQLRDAISCTLGRDDYIEILRGKGLL